MKMKRKIGGSVVYKSELDVVCVLGSVGVEVEDLTMACCI